MRRFARRATENNRIAAMINCFDLHQRGGLTAACVVAEEFAKRSLGRAFLADPTFKHQFGICGYRQARYPALDHPRSATENRTRYVEFEDAFGHLDAAEDAVQRVMSD